MSYKTFCTRCTSCSSLTSKSYARANGGKCKACVSGVPKALPSLPRDISNHPLLCPTCQERLRSQYQKDRGYHCDSCTREADPMGYARELSTPQEPYEYDAGDGRW